ncbi:MAG: hypothetical protein K0S14_3060, partial [Thermomicrobiales bacterium]|nr:hypothetical protein [Thermomicrobiales bacterium]
AQALRVAPDQFVGHQPGGMTLLTVAEAASRLEVPAGRVQTWLREGLLSGVKVSAGAGGRGGGTRAEWPAAGPLPAPRPPLSGVSDHHLWLYPATVGGTLPGSGWGYGCALPAHGSISQRQHPTGHRGQCGHVPQGWDHPAAPPPRRGQEAAPSRTWRSGVKGPSPTTRTRSPRDSPAGRSAPA